MSKNTEKMILPSLLSFERKIETSDAMMYAGNWCDDINSEKIEWKKISITKRQNRSTQSAHGTNDYEKTQPNPVSSDNDDANLPADKDALKVSFTLRVIGNLGKPFACNDPGFESAIVKKVSEFKDADSGGYTTIANRYAYNIANGRFLWRNRVCAEAVKIYVNIKGQENSLDFDAYDFSLNDFSKNSEDQKLQKLANIIREGFDGDNQFTLLEVNAYVNLGKGQHVFPSEEMNMGEKKKTLFKLNDCAAIHNVKIGNAIRTIDTWYGDNILIATDDKKTKEISIEGEDKTPIAIEPFGSVTQRGTAFRHQNTDLYSLLLKWVNDETISDDDKLYVVANFIRGGVFSRKKAK